MKMRIALLIGILTALMIAAVPAMSASNMELEERVADLEKQLGAAEENTPSGRIPEWVTVSGAMEVEVGFESGDTYDTSDISLTTAEVGIESAPLEWLTGFMLISWDDEAHDLFIDEAHITLGRTDNNPYYLAAGKIYVPFGSFETMMISDPITLDIGEIKDNAVQAGIEMNGFHGAAYLFNGEVDEAGDDDTIGCFGFSLGYAVETDTYSVEMGVDWINNILESGALSEAVADGGGDLREYVPGYSVHAMAHIGPVRLIGEWVHVADDIEMITAGTFDSPSAYAFEAGYIFDVSGYETILAVGYQSSDDACGLLPETVLLGSVRVKITDNLSIAAEYRTAEDYSVADGGTGEDVDTLTFQLALGF